MLSFSLAYWPRRDLDSAGAHSAPSAASREDLLLRRPQRRDMPRTAGIMRFLAPRHREAEAPALNDRSRSHSCIA